MTSADANIPRLVARTIGHSNHTVERLVELLRMHGITAVADVRSSPFSSYSPQFNRDQLKRRLTVEGIAYVFLGTELGGRPTDETMYDVDGHVNYQHVAEGATFRDGMERLIRGIDSHRVAVLCGEEDPISCHRRRLVGRVLVELGITIEHVLGDGTIATEAAIALREASEFPERLQMTLDGPPAWRSQHPVKREQTTGGDRWSDS